VSLHSFGFQLGAELLKARRRTLLYVSLGVLLFFAVLPLPITLAALRDSNLREWASGLVSFPAGLWNTLRMAHVTIPILTAVVAGAVVGGEYAHGTWKMILPRTPGRASPLAAKFVVCLLFTLGGLWLFVALSCAVAALGAALLGVPFVPGPVELGAAELLRIQAFFLLEFTFLISLTMFAVVLTRSLIGGILLGYLAQHLLGLITFLPGGWLSPMTNLDALQSKWLPQSRFGAADVEAALGHSMSSQASTAVVLLSCLAFGLLALWLFQRRDLASE
jgi:ABC-type transport system involved in multi-copper enzyme maturation permease subunit